MLVCWLGKVLVDRKMSRQALADAVGCSTNLIARAVNHQPVPVDLALSIARFLNKDISDLWVIIDP